MMNVAVCDEDRLTLRQVVEKISHMKGTSVCEGYDNFQELIQALRSGRYQIVFLSMDWKNSCERYGLQTARQIYKISPDIKVIYMTANPQQVVEQLFLEPVNRSGFLVKPVEGEILTKYIEYFVRGGGKAGFKRQPDYPQ